ncbi:hypothetical protein UlMin_016968 [Ulmus minor]
MYEIRILSVISIYSWSPITWQRYGCIVQPLIDELNELWVTSINTLMLKLKQNYGFSLIFCTFNSGLSLGLGFGSNIGLGRGKWCGLVVRVGKYKLCQTKRNRSQKSLARTHSFCRRMRTTSGKTVLKRRRAKGWKVLCTKSNPSSDK